MLFAVYAASIVGGVAGIGLGLMPGQPLGIWPMAGGFALIALAYLSAWAEERLLRRVTPPELRAVVPSLLTFAGFNGTGTRGRRGDIVPPG